MANWERVGSATLQDIISKSLLIKSGPPNLYQLVPKKQSLDGKKKEESKLRRWTIGERNHSMANKTFLLVGDRGAGKTTLINTMVNYVMGVKWEDEVWFEIIEEDKRSLPQSWTSEVIVYDILGFEGLKLPFSLTIVDTPGYDDPKWNKGDKEVAENLHILLRSKDGIDQIDVVGLVMKATEEFLSEKQKYIFDEVASLFDKTMKNKIVALLTHSDGGPATNALQALKTADIRCDRDEKNQPVHFLFNIGQTITASEFDIKCWKNALKTIMDGMDTFLEFLKQVTPQGVKITVDVQTEHEQIKVSSQEKIQLVDEKKDSEGNNFSSGPGSSYVKEIVCRFSGKKDGTTAEGEPNVSISQISAPGQMIPPKIVQQFKEKAEPGTANGEKTPKDVSYSLTTRPEVASEKEEDSITTRPEVASKKAEDSITTRPEEASKKADDSTTTRPEVASKKAEDSITTRPEVASKKAEDSIRNSGTSSKLDYIILKSTVIHKGPPIRYRMIPRKETLDGKCEDESKLKKWTIGEKDPSKVNRTVLLVGETGAGKTTMINAMINYVMGVEREDKIWFEIPNEGKRSQTESQTSEVIAYEIFGFEGGRVPYSLTIIDTPGYGDTRGIQEDRLITEMLHDLFRSPNGIDQIDAVGFVVKASTNRLSDRQRYIFDAVLSLFGKDMKDQIVALISNSDGGPATNALKALEKAQIKCAKDKDNQPVHFLFNNRQTEMVTNKKEERVMRLAWDVTMEGMDEFSEFLGKISPQKLKMTVDVLTERVQLEAFVNNLHERIQRIESDQDMLKQMRNEVRKHKKEIDENKNFVITVTETYKEKVTIDATWTKKALCCTVCEENCHYPGCTIAKSAACCEVMQDGLCTACTGRCPVSNHVRENWRYVQRTREITRTYDDLKKKYEENFRAAGEKSDLMACLKKDLDDAERDKAILVEESYQCVVKLEKIALRSNSLSTYVHLDFLIEKLKEKNEVKKACKLEKMQRCAEEGQKKGMDYIRTALGLFWDRK